MLKLVIPGREFWNEITNEFEYSADTVLELEHSLVSISKWESEWEIPFLSEEEHTDEQVFSYIRAMTVTPNVPIKAYDNLTSENLDSINKYINAKMTATWISANRSPTAVGKKETITSELIYYWMVALNIPPEYQHWHLARLLMLVQVCNEKNSPNNKKTKTFSGDQIAQRRAENARRRAEMNSTG